MTDTAIAKAISVIHERYPEKLSVHTIADEVAFSRYYFTRLFRKCTGVSPGQYLIAVRMAAAKRLLATTALSVGEVVERVGYTSVGTFTTRFSSAVGMSPARYRRQSAGLLDGLADGAGTQLRWLPVLDRPDRPRPPARRSLLGSALVVLTTPWEVAAADPLLDPLGRVPPPYAVAYRTAISGYSVGLAVYGLPAGPWVLAATACRTEPGGAPTMSLAVGDPITVTPGRVRRVDVSIGDDRHRLIS